MKRAPKPLTAMDILNFMDVLRAVTTKEIASEIGRNIARAFDAANAEKDKANDRK
jgi:hypothetical protein